MSLTSQCCHCGSLPSTIPDLQKIAELEDQVETLTAQAASAADKIAGYEDEVCRLKSMLAQPVPLHDTALDAAVDDPTLQYSQRVLAPTPTTTSAPSSTTQETGITVKRPTAAQRFSSFLNSRKSSPSNTPSSQNPPRLSDEDSRAASVPPTTLLSSLNLISHSDSATRDVDLKAALTRELKLRTTAETKLIEVEAKLTQVNSEVEELSSTLFQQANEMVATERKTRAKLEENVRVWEAKARKFEERVQILEKREQEKIRRLEMLEVAVGRVERVKNLLIVGNG